MEIKIDLKSNRETLYKNKIIGKTFENKATILIFELDDEMIDKDFYIEFEKIDGTKFSTPKIDILEKEVKYQVPNSLLDLKGDLKVEVVLRKDGAVFKSYTMKFVILESINATEEIPNQYPDFVGEAQKVIDLIEFEGIGNKYLTDDGTYKSMQEIAGGVSDYEQLNNKPSINNIELSNNKSLASLGIQEKMDAITNTELDAIFSDLIQRENLTNEQIKAINNMSCSLDNDGNLQIDYDDTALDINFKIENGDLIAETNVDNLLFNINNNGEMEAIY